MRFDGEVIKNESYDPYYKLKFFYETDELRIDKGYVEVIRKSPRSTMVFDFESEEKLKAVDKSKLELELLNVIMKHLFSTRSNRVFGNRTVNFL